MLNFANLFVTATFIVCTLGGAPLFKPCDQKDANYKQCLIDTGNSVFQTLKNGNSKLKIPSINPLILPAITIQQSYLLLNLRNISINGLGSAKLIDIDFSENELVIKASIPKLEIIGPYKASGKILFIEIAGEGKANITCINGIYTVSSSFTTIKKHGEEYFELNQTKLVYKLEKAVFDFENLLRSEDLGIDMNKILNDNWEPVLDEIGGGIEKSFEQIYKLVVSGLFNKVPKKNFFAV